MDRASLWSIPLHNIPITIRKFCISRYECCRHYALLAAWKGIGLDATLREEMRFEIRRLHDEFRVTTVYVTHDQAEAMVTSDRIAVMNYGRIEQVDDPRALYNKPTTRFVAGFIGRTNFIEGTCDGHQVSFDGFALPRSALDLDVSPGGKAVFSVRPHSIRLCDVAPAARAGCSPVEVVVLERAFLGEHWDYVVRPREGRYN